MTETQDWTATYQRARARASAAFGLPDDHEMVINTASAVASLELAEAEMGLTPTAREQADRQATDELLARLRATAPEAQAQAEPTPDPASAALARAVAALNSSRGVTPTHDDKAAVARAGRADGATGTEGGQVSDATAAAFAKATASINARR